MPKKKPVQEEHFLVHPSPFMETCYLYLNAAFAYIFFFVGDTIELKFSLMFAVSLIWVFLWFKSEDWEKKQWRVGILKHMTPEDIEWWCSIFRHSQSILMVNAALKLGEMFFCETDLENMPKTWTCTWYCYYKPMMGMIIILIVTKVNFSMNE
ncbi:uncharacterized protein LOC126843418 [Adelges cooleyi]|uniref:uncharacterized protein LOC126843418 n=1 Tax=Adelges cooleyi TaxID=133065 RepID=UPI00217F947E|nr:uncharacterized protein LOC126843418 [Adelges cooleyi]